MKTHRFTRHKSPIRRAASILLGATLFYSSTVIQPQPSSAANGCGPSDRGLLVPDGPFPFLSYFDAFATFEDACDNHDDCYGQDDTSQVDCDRNMYVEMLEACDQDYAGLIADYCKNTAGVFHAAVAEYGEISKQGTVEGTIVGVSARRIDDWWGDDEFEACATVENTGLVNTEFDLVLYSSRGKHIDTEPDTYEVNLAVGEQTKICVGTDNIYPSISDLGRTYTLVLRVDDYTKDFQETDRESRRTP